MSGILNKKKPQAQPLQNVKVVVRVRPLNKQEDDPNVKNIIKLHTHRELLVKDKKYTFDRVFKPHSSQIEVYSNVVAPLIQDVVAGYNCTVFAYGQTGSGKTFTMTGDKCSISGNWKEDDEAGIIPRASFHIFEELGKLSRAETVVKVSYIELYNEEIRDLLSEDEGTLSLYSDTKGGLFIQGMREIAVYDSEGICKMLQRGIVKRQIAPTLMNHQSSRSHTVFTISVNISETTITGDDILKSGKINLVDLAGSENIARSGCKDLRAMELANINRSLLTLGRVIHALADRAQKHIPYRDSKLTRILQDSLGGHTKTVIIATVSPAHTSQEETCSTLDYATRARDIKNAPVMNEKMTKHEMIDGLIKEIDRLQRDLDAARTGTGFYVNKDNYQRLLDAIMTVTGEQITAEEFECKRAERIQNLEAIMRMKMQQFEDTIQECKKHEEELQIARNTMKQKDEILEKEAYISKWYENQTNERFAENQILIKATNMLNNEKEILLAKLENQFRINSTNETLINGAIGKVLSLTDTFHKEVEDTFMFHKNLQLQCRDDFLNQKTDLKKYSKEFKDVQNNTIHSDLLKNLCIRETLESHARDQEGIIQGKLVSLEKVLLNCDQHLKTFQLMIQDMVYMYKEKIEQSFENLHTMVNDDLLSQNNDSSDLIDRLTKMEDHLAERLVQDEKHLKELEYTAGIIKFQMETDRSFLNLLESTKNEVIQKKEKRTRKMKMKMRKFKQQALDSIEEFVGKFGAAQEVQKISGEEVQEIMKLIKQFVYKLNDFSTSFEEAFKSAAEELQNYVIKSMLQIYSDIGNSLDRTFNRYVMNTGTMIESSDEFVKSFDAFIENIKDIFKNEILKKNIKVRHMGDTPVKKSLDLPIRIKELTPREMLLEKFSQTREKEQESE